MVELIRPGVTGFLVDDQDAAVEAVRSLRTIDRSACRMDVLDRFTADRMVDDYAALFATVVG
jgi:hypothetical protein